jgi:hypothetical protein
LISSRSANLFRLAVETAPAGSVLHGAAEDAAEHFGWLGAFFAADVPASRARTGWAPAHPGLLADLEAGHYCAAPAVSR